MHILLFDPDKQLRFERMLDSQMVRKPDNSKANQPLKLQPVPQQHNSQPPQQQQQQQQQQPQGTVGQQKESVKEKVKCHVL